MNVTTWLREVYFLMPNILWIACFGIVLISLIGSIFYRREGKKLEKFYKEKEERKLVWCERHQMKRYLCGCNLDGTNTLLDVKTEKTKVTQSK
jgi:hypothetical protein